MLLSAVNVNAATGSRNDDFLLFGGGIVVLGLILGIIYLIGFIKRKISEYKKNVSEES